MTRKLAIIPFAILMGILLISLFMGQSPTEMKDHPEIDTGDTAWMLTSAALVLIMTPGLAFFYGGMVKKKNVISTMLQSFICMAIVTIIWVVFGFSLAFGQDMGGIIGNPGTFFLMNGVLDGDPWPGAPTVPLAVFAFFQLKFAIITPALVTGAFSERIRFTSYILFICLFIIFIYCPLAHATWHPDGILAKWGVLDFAGGTVVHMSAGLVALAGALYLKKRTDVSDARPARITYVLIGTGLLWFGWFGFNGGSAMGANSLAASALATTAVASGVAAFAWILFDAIRGKKPSAMGTSIGAVVGLVAITPAAGFVSIPHALVIGIVAAIISNIAVEWRTKTSIDDTLDVFPCHGIGGMVGMLLTGVFANKGINAVVADNGLFFGETKLFTTHVLALLCVIAFVLIGGFILLKITDLITPLRATPEEEIEGLDISQHGEQL